MSEDSAPVTQPENNPEKTASVKSTPLIGSQRETGAFRQKSVIPVVVEPLPEDMPIEIETSSIKELKLNPTASTKPGKPVPVPSIRGGLSDDLEDEFNEIFGGAEIDSLMSDVDKVASQEILESETKLKGKIVSISGENVFVELGSREQGVVPGKMFKKEPILGDEIEVIVMKYLKEEGLYDLAVPLAAADVREWEQVAEGMILNAKIVKVNTGGFECEVNKLRGFIPMGQISIIRVDNPEAFIGETLPCVVLEANPTRRNLVLSRRVMLEREREEIREKTLSELAEGQEREGVVRKLIDVGAFVDLGGVDGFIPIGAMSWGRINHPKEVLNEGDRIKVKVTKIDREKDRISLIYRDDALNPWNDVYSEFPEKTKARGKVTKIMDFGAFVELKPGLEGLVHISELAHQRIARVTDVLKVGDWVEVMIQSVDPASKRIGLSVKQLIDKPQPDTSEAAKEEEEKNVAVPVPVKFKNQPKGPLKGGTGGNAGGEKFGLNW